MCVSGKVLYNISKTILGIQSSKLCLRVASQVAKQLKTQGPRYIGSTKQNIQLGWRDTSVRNLTCKNQFLAIVVKTYAKADIKVFLSCHVLRYYDYYYYYHYYYYYYYLQNILSLIASKSKSLLLTRLSPLPNLNDLFSNFYNNNYCYETHLF